MPTSDLLNYLFPDFAYLAYEKKKKKLSGEKKQISRF